MNSDLRGNCTPPKSNSAHGTLTALRRFQYTWANNEYLVYYITWQDMLKNPDKLFYILYPRSRATLTSGHCAESDALILAAGKWTSQLHDEIFVFDDGHWEKSRDLWASVHAASWADVILSASMKNSLMADVQGFFDAQATYAHHAVPWKRGVLLHGSPGNGKTASIKALMGALYARPDGGIPSLYVKSFDTACNTEQFAIRQIFTRARAMAPCLLVFEDLDSLVGENVRSYFLNEVDGLETNDGILMLGSTNHLDKLDPAISRRPSRFDRKYHFALPRLQEREAYALYWRGKLTQNDTVDFPEELAGVVAALTDGFSFAYLKEVFVMALMCLVQGGTGEVDEGVERREDARLQQNGAENGTDEEKPAEVETCTCTTKCRDCDKPLPESTTAEQKKAANAKQAQSEDRAKFPLPHVEIPESLEGNLLLRVIKHQIRNLHAEMDTSNSEEPRMEKGPSRKPGADYAEQMRMLKRANARRV